MSADGAIHLRHRHRRWRRSCLLPCFRFPLAAVPISAHDEYIYSLCSVGIGGSYSGMRRGAFSWKVSIPLRRHYPRRRRWRLLAKEITSLCSKGTDNSDDGTDGDFLRGEGQFYAALAPSTATSVKYSTALGNLTVAYLPLRRQLLPLCVEICLRHSYRRP